MTIEMLDNEIQQLGFVLNNYNELYREGRVTLPFIELDRRYQYLLREKQSLLSGSRPVQHTANMQPQSAFGTLYQPVQTMYNTYPNAQSMTRMPSYQSTTSTYEPYANKGERMNYVDQDKQEKVQETVKAETVIKEVTNLLDFNGFLKENGVSVKGNTILGLSKSKDFQYEVLDNFYDESVNYFKDLQLDSGIILNSPYKSIFNGTGSLTKYLNKPFSEIRFSSIATDTCLLNLYIMLKDILLEHISMLLDVKYPNSTELSDIEELISSEDIPTKKLNKFYDVFSKMELAKIEGVEDYVALSTGGSYVIVNDTDTDYEYLRERLISKDYNKPLRLTEESYKSLYNLIYKYARPHGTLELSSGIRFKYTKGENEIKINVIC